MRVLLVCHGYPPDGIAGVERLSAQTAEALARRGHEVTVLTARPGERPASPVLRRDTRAGIPVVAVAGGASTPEAFPGHEPRLETIFERMLVETAPDVVLATHLMHHSPGYVRVAHRLGIPFALELHDFFMLCPRAHLLRRNGDLCGGPEGGSACARHCFGDQHDPQLRWSLRSESFAAAVRDADAVLAPSRLVADAFSSRRGGAEISVVPNAVADFGPVLRTESDRGGPLHLASIGVTVEHKGFQTVVEALRLARLPAVRYTIFGAALAPLCFDLLRAGDEIEGLELRLYDRFEPHHLPVLLADVDALAIPSLVPETYSIVAREGLACGIPLIAAAIGALPEAVREGENGWLFEPGDAAGLALLLQRLDRDREMLARAAQGADEEAVVSVSQRTDAVESILRSAVAGGPRDDAPGRDELGLMREALVESDASRGRGQAP
jgi:glycosyltransferase involved in cell wall biosynthesis